MLDQDEELRLSGKKILVVDDDYEVRSALDHALQSEGALTQSCGDGNSAVRICESDPPDLVVLDMMLPKRSGFLVLERVKRAAETPPKVIMVTANEGRRHRQYAEDLGVDGYILKPVRLERLIGMCEQLLDAPAES
jgi:DNA-binding response OmpR family regulator